MSLLFLCLFLCNLKKILHSFCFNIIKHLSINCLSLSIVFIKDSELSQKTLKSMPFLHDSQEQRMHSSDGVTILGWPPLEKYGEKKTGVKGRNVGGACLWLNFRPLEVLKESSVEGSH